MRKAIFKCQILLSRIQLCTVGPNFSNSLNKSASSSEYYFLKNCGISIVIQSLSHVRLFVARQASLSFTISQCLLKLMSIESVMPSKHLILLSPSPPVLKTSKIIKSQI